MSKMIIPKGYETKLSLVETQIAIKTIKDFFERELSKQLNIIRVTAPLFVLPETGLNDNLSGAERPVDFKIPNLNNHKAEVVQSLAKWKRNALKEYGFKFIGSVTIYSYLQAVGIINDHELECDFR